MSGCVCSIGMAASQVQGHLLASEGCHGSFSSPLGGASVRKRKADCADVLRDRSASAGWIAAAERVTVLTGAGISTDSGIPDFRGPQGVWTKNPTAEKTSTLQHYLAEPDVRRTAWKTRVDSPLWSAEPNAGHRAIVDIERAGKPHGVVTQNIDELHQKAGNDPELVIEVHGTAWWTRCLSCGDRRPMLETLERVRGGDEDPPCLVCGGILKSDTISFGQSLVPEVIDRAMAVSRSCDVLLAVGSTLSVYPAASCVPLAAAAGANVGSSTPGHRDGWSRWGGAARSDLRAAAGRRRRGEGCSGVVSTLPSGRLGDSAAHRHVHGVHRGRTLDEEGFIHASYEWQWRAW